MSKQGYVYILSNKHNTTLYTGVTNNLKRRIAEHKLHINRGFTYKYKVEKLVYFEICNEMTTAIYREKQLKKWHREWKEALINDFNPGWEDLSDSIGLDEEYIQSVKELYSENSGDRGSSPR
jgi:putative endonuclease